MPPQQHDTDPPEAPKEKPHLKNPKAEPAKAEVPAKAEPTKTWALIAHDKKVSAGWDNLCRHSLENAIHAYDWLSTDAMKWKPGRCYPLRGKKYAGCWGYEIGSGDRLYYKPDEKTKTAKFYYAGPHPEKGIPLPPEAL